MWKWSWPDLKHPGIVEGLRNTAKKLGEDICPETMHYKLTCRV